MFTRNFARLIGVILFISSVILVTFTAGLMPLNSNQTVALLLIIAGCVGGVGLMMVIGWFSTEETRLPTESEILYVAEPK